MKTLAKVIAGVLMVLGAVGAANAGGVSVTCGDSSLGLRTTTVNPALAGSCYAGLQNLGDPQLEALINSEYGISDADLIDRDTANENGGSLSITGVGTGVGTWSFDSSLWASNQRIFLYFHFGDGQDDPSGTSTTDPDIFIVELLKSDNMGDWLHFDGTDNGRQQYGLSNIGLIRGGQCTFSCGTTGDETPLPEPASIALVGLALLGVGLSRRRKASSI